MEDAAVVLAKLGRIDESLEAAERGTAVGPDIADCWFVYAALLARTGRDEEALGAVERAMTLDPGRYCASEDAWLLKGRCLMDLGRPDEAGTAFGTSIGLRRDARRRGGPFGRRRR